MYSFMFGSSLRRCAARVAGASLAVAASGTSYSSFTTTTHADNAPPPVGRTFFGKERSTSSFDRAPAPSVKACPGSSPREGEPTFSREEVRKHDGTDGNALWVTYRGAVYDITEFQKSHPGGGDLIKQTAGGDIEPFWRTWSYHHQAPSVGRYLDALRIGVLEDEEEDILEKEEEKPVDVPTTALTNRPYFQVSSIGRYLDVLRIGAFGEQEETKVEVDEEEGCDDHDPYEAEPVRAMDVQTVLMNRPYCSETPSAVLGSSYLTPADAFYVRNHAPVPECGFEDPREHELVFERHGKSDKVFSIAQLGNRFPSVTITSILQCAGNRASEDIAATGTSGFTGTPFENIQQGEIGNAIWTGVRLADVLEDMYPEICEKVFCHGEDDEWHIVFCGADGYSSSTPLIRVLQRDNDCLLATKMNGKALSPDHGHPIRALLPGIAGARNVKWLHSIKLQKGSADTPWNTHYYKNANGEDIQGLPIQSIILSVERDDNDKQRRNNTKVSGVAYSGSAGNAIARVEVSVDGGESWIGAKLLSKEVTSDDSSKRFGWIRWTADIDSDCASVCCRATDSEGNTQPKVSAKQRGYLYNGWHFVSVQ